MAKMIGIVGFSGTGKTFSLRNLPPEETAIVSPYKLDLPFAGADVNYKLWTNENQSGNIMKVPDLPSIPSWVEYFAGSGKKYIVIDDITHGINNYIMNPSFRAKGKTKESWSRWEDMAADVYASLIRMADTLPADVWLVMMFHPEVFMGKNGEELKLRTPGKLLEEKIDIPSYFTYMLYTTVETYDKEKPKPAAERYKFVTNNDGYYPAKMPPECVEDMYIPNDLMDVIYGITAYRLGMSKEELKKQVVQ